MQTQPLLVEIRCEELPPAQVHALAKNFPQQLLAALQHAGFADAEAAPLCSPDGIPWQLATPRRFAALLGGIRSESARTATCRRGPLLDSCYDAQGEPTRALRGFMQAVGTSTPAALTQVEEKGRTYIAFHVSSGGVDLNTALAEIVEGVLRATNAPRLMRWGDHEFKFIRPLRGVLLLHGARALGGTVLGVSAGDSSYGHPALANTPLTIAQAPDYAETLAQHGAVLADINQRRAAIRAQLNGAAPPPHWLDEVTALCEQPGVYAGTIDDAFVQLPAFCVEECMVTHQRAFPVYAQGALSTRYLFVADNRPHDASAIIRGMNTVLRARLRDLQFYLQEDAKLSSEAALAKLEQITYHRALGSQRARVTRLCAIAEWLGTQLALPAAQQAQLLQAATLCKSDLSTLTISEHPQLEGQVAALLFCADTPAVAALVRCHNRRDWQAAAQEVEDAQTAYALILAVQLEKLLGMFAAGEKPSGSKDPHGLRTAAALAAELLTQCGRTFTLDAALNAAAATFADAASAATAESVAAVRTFLLERKRQQLLEQGSAAAVLNAVLARPAATLSEVEEKAAALTQFLTLPQAAALSEAHKRIDNILRKSAAANLPAVQIDLLQEEAEKALHAQLCTQQQHNQEAAARHDYATLLHNTAALHASVEAFFTQVRVNTDDTRVRDNRLTLLTALRDLFNSVGDLSKLSSG